MLPTASFARTPADWTAMVFLNAGSDLENDAIESFEAMARVGSTNKVNIVVQFSRTETDAQTNSQWNHALRFRVTKGMEPSPASAVQDMGDVDMGSQAALRDFIDWSAQNRVSCR